MRTLPEALAGARTVCVLTGAGVSAESGIPTFRGAGGLWRTYSAFDLASPSAFRRSPSLVWEFYHYRREVVSRCKPNDGHLAIAAFQRKLRAEGRSVDIVTQNIDRLHQAAGAEDVIELHGSLWLLKKVGTPGFVEDGVQVWEDRTVPLAPCFEGKCKPDPDIMISDIPVSELPHRDGQLLRPAVVWFGEDLDPTIGLRADQLLDACDLLLVVGTSATVSPAAEFAAIVAERGVPVAEVNLEPTANTEICQYAFHGKSGELLPKLLGVEAEVAALRRDLRLGAEENLKLEA